MIFIIISIILCIILFISIIIKDKLTFINIKLKTIEEKINSTLINKKSLLLDSETIIKDTLKTSKDIYENIEELNNSNIDIIELDTKLLLYINEFNLINEKYKKLQKNNDFQQIASNLNESDEQLLAYKKYYNDTVTSYNKLISTFPINMINLIKRRKKKKLFDNNSNN